MPTETTMSEIEINLTNGMLVVKYKIMFNKIIISKP